MTPRDLLQDEQRSPLYQALPSVNDLLLMPACCEFLKSHSRTSLVRAIRGTLAELRYEISSGCHTSDSLKQRISQIPDVVLTKVASDMPFSLRSVINATGVVLHTNLGRAPLSEAALQHVVDVAQDYCNLELDLDTGSRSRRDVHAENLLLRVLYGESSSTVDRDRHAVVIVNNCAAATLLALNSLAEKREVIVSRGETHRDWRRLSYPGNSGEVRRSS